MIQMQKVRSLEMQSQHDVVEKLHFMTRLGSNVIALSGQRGAGKSWLLQRYYRGVATEYRAFLTGHQSLSLDTAKQEIFKQLLPGAHCDTSAHLFDSLDRHIGLSPAEFVIVIDDAGLCQSDVLQELWGLAERCQDHPLWSLSLILSSGPELLSQHILPLGRTFSIQPMELSVPPLSPKDATLFLELRVLRQFECLKRRDKIRKKAAGVAQYPGTLLALAMSNKEQKRALFAHHGSVKYSSIIFVFLLLILAVGWWAISQNPVFKETEERVTASSDTELSVQPDNEAPLSTDGQPQMVEDSAALPPPVAETTATVGEQQNGRQRVVVPDALVETLLEEEVKPAVPAPQPAEPESISEPVAAQFTFSFAREELLATSANRYTLQLAALRTLEEVQRFIDNHRFQQQVRIYPTLRGEKRWYIITYQDFRYVSQATEAIEQLPDTIREQGPWVKSMSQVHKEIENGK